MTTSWNASVADVHPAEGWFRSIALFPGTSSRKLIPDVDVLSAFVERHDIWYRRAVGRRADLFYNREVCVSELLPLSLAEDAKRLGEACKILGYGFSISVDLDEGGDEEAHALDELLAFGVVTGLGIIVPSASIVADWGKARRARWMARCEAMFDSGTLIGLVGCIAGMRSLSILGSSAINRSNVTIYSQDARWADRGQSRALGDANGCFARMRVFVDPAGYVFPCLGMLVAERTPLGHISEWPQEDFELGAYQHDLARLARCGPENAQVQSDRRAENLPLVCERHLSFLATHSTETRVPEGV